GHGAVSDDITEDTMRELAELGYISEPHAAIAYRVLRDQLQDGEFGVFIATAHPAKFKESVEEILAQELPLPKPLAVRAQLPLLSHDLPADFAQLRTFLMALPK
ncbi:threonine synthase, partial [Yersinia enterocolitica]